MKAISLPDFLIFLNACSAQDFSGDGVDKFLSEHRLNQDDFLPFIFFREETYGRNLVFKTELYELLILTWLPKQRTPIHDHFGQRCWMVIQAGTLLFKNFKPVAPDCHELVVSGPLETHQAGDSVYIDDGMGVHSIANCATKPAISMHLYAGPIPRCRRYNEEIKRFEWSELDYFTSPEIYQSESRKSPDGQLLA